VFGEKATLATTVLNLTLDEIPRYNSSRVFAIRWDIWKPEGKRRTSIAGRRNARLRTYKQIVQMRKEEAALTAGELTWINNSNPNRVVSFVPKRPMKDPGDGEPDESHQVQVDVPTADYAQARDLMKNRMLPASLAPDDLTCRMGAFDYVVAKRGSKTP
jgi:hypothetical protein